MRKVIAILFALILLGFQAFCAPADYKLVLVSTTVQSSLFTELLVAPWYLAFRPGLRERRTPPEDLSAIVHAK